MASFSTYMTQPIGYVPVGVYTPPITSVRADRLAGTRGIFFGESDYGSFTKATYVGFAGLLSTVIGTTIWVMKGKKAHTAAKIAAFGIPLAAAVIFVDRAT